MGYMKTIFPLLFKSLLILSILVFLRSLMYFLYPTPGFFWNAWHRRDFTYVRELSRKLGSTAILGESIRCWEVMNDRCGIVLVFSTALEMDAFKTRVSGLHYEKRLSRDIDGYGMLTAIDFNTKKSLQANGITDVLTIRNTVKRPSSWGWWLMNEEGKSVVINYFTPDPQDHYVLDSEDFRDNIVELIYYTRGM